YYALNFKEIKSKETRPNRAGGHHSFISFMESNLAPTITPYSGIGFNFEFRPKVGIPAGLQGGFGAFFNVQWNRKENDYKGYGYMYNPNSTQHATDQGNDDMVMSDYYIEKSAPYSQRDHVVGIPFNNAYMFNATGEGLMGSFRLHH